MWLKKHLCQLKKHVTELLYPLQNSTSKIAYRDVISYTYTGEFLRGYCSAGKSVIGIAQDLDLIPSATKTLVNTPNNEAYIYDYDDTTYADYWPGAQSAKDVIIWDFGNIANRAIYGKVGGGWNAAGGAASSIEISDDGATWTPVIYSTYNNTVTGVYFGSFRYVKWRARDDTAAGNYTNYLYTLEVYNTVNGENTIETTSSGLAIFLTDGTPSDRFLAKMVNWR